MPRRLTSLLMSRSSRRTSVMVALVLCAMAQLAAQAGKSPSLIWFKFSKDFISRHYATDSALGELVTTDPKPAKTVHPSTCGGHDGEIHIGIFSDSLTDNPKGIPNSSLATDDVEFGIVAEPVNLTPATAKLVQKINGKETTFTGYFRVWNEGHYTGAVHDSNPYHVLEVHPSWAFQSEAAKADFNSPQSIAPMKGYQGYGASHFRPLLESLTKQQWLKVYEDDQFVFVQLAKSDNFYQLPIKISGSSQDIHGGTSVTVSVYSDAARKNLIYKELNVVSNEGSRIAGRFQKGEKLKFLLGIFSVNLEAAMKAAAGHQGEDAAVFAPEALEFFAYGVPLLSAVKNSKCVEETGD
jgi:hypothetical protein